jgi:Uma2 family endonuclease
MRHGQKIWRSRSNERLLFRLIMQISLEQAMQMPDAALFAQKLDSALKAEQKKRRHFYEIVEENKKMEFINGEIVFQSPVKLKQNDATVLLGMLLKAFVAKHKLGFVGLEKIMVSLTRNDYEPDICFFSSEKSKKFKRNQMQFPPPDFVVEVLSDSTEKNDRETKFQDYAAHGVQEYWIIDAEKQTVEQYFLQNERYDLLLKSKSGEINSVVLTDFKIPIRSVFDETENVKTLTDLVNG